jgi:hypothetical protein
MSFAYHKFFPPPPFSNYRVGPTELKNLRQATLKNYGFKKPDNRKSA